MSDKVELKFEAREPGIYFKCEHAVFPVGGDNSLCYTTSRERAEWIADRLNTRHPNPELLKALDGCDPCNICILNCDDAKCSDKESHIKCVELAKTPASP